MPWNAPPIIRRRVHNITDRAGVITRAEHTSDQTITHYSPEWNPQDKSVNQFPVARIIPHHPSFLLHPSSFILYPYLRSRSTTRAGPPSPSLILSGRQINS